MKRRPLVEIATIEILEKHVFTESEADSQNYLMRVKSVSQHADKKNANGRIYPYAILEREVKRIQADIKKTPGSVLEQGDHPMDGLAKIRGVAAMLESIELDPATKRVITVSKIFKTEVGKDLAAILEGGGLVGRSSRGYGATERGEVLGEVGDVVQEDYQLKTIDFVIGQSTHDAYVTQIMEQALEREEGDGMDIKTLTLDELKAARPELLTQLEAAATTAAETKATAAMETKLTTIVTEKAAEIEKGIIKDLGEAAPQKPDNVKQADWDKMSLGQKMKACKAASDDDANEQTVTARADKLGFRLVKKDGTDPVAKVEADLATTKRSLTEAMTALGEQQEKTRVLEEAQNNIAIDKHIMKVATDQKVIYKNALIEGLRAANCKTIEEVNAKLPTEKARIERLLEETGGGKGSRGDFEERGTEHSDPDKDKQKFKVKNSTGQIVEMTEAQIVQRKRAGIVTELVEA